MTDGDDTSRQTTFADVLDLVRHGDTTIFSVAINGLQFGFGELNPELTMRLVIPSATAVLLAFNLAYSGFFVSILQIRSRRSGAEGEASKVTAGFVNRPRKVDAGAGARNIGSSAPSPTSSN